MNSLISKKILKLKSSNGWNGVVARKWSDLVFAPAELIKNSNQIFKSEKGNITLLKQIQGANGSISFAVKKTVGASGIKWLIDYFRTPKSLRNFKLALLLKQNDIEVAEPVVAFWNLKENIYVTEYIPNSLNLYEIAFGKNIEIINNFSAKKAVVQKVAEIIAKLHKAGFWHRDSKAGNFIIYKEERDYKVKLIDLDGIKKNFISSGEKQIRTLANLAKTLTRFKTVNLADLYRGFIIYCRAMEFNERQSKELFRKIERATVKLRLLTVLEESKKFKEECPSK